MHLKKSMLANSIGGPAGTRISNSQQSNFEINSAFEGVIEKSITESEQLHFEQSLSITFVIH